jgi:hypothetical protein
MKIRTSDELSTKLYDDMVWREQELRSISQLINNESFPKDMHKALLRGGVCILYAHWEGFIKSAANSYVSFVRTKKLTYKELSVNFLALAMKTKLSNAKETNKPSVYIPVCNFFVAELGERSHLPEDDISAASNLSSTVLEEIISVLGLDFSLYSTKRKLIDYKLVQNRNKIAHGENLTLDKTDYSELHANVMGMLNTFKNQIENAVLEGKFKALPIEE